MVKRNRKPLQFTEEAALVQLDLGTGKGMKKPPGYIGVDRVKADGVDLVFDLAYRNGAGFKPWPWKTESIDNVAAEYLLQCLTSDQRVHFVNELWRVLKVGAQAKIVTPYWCANRAYMALEAQWPPVSEGWFMTLNRTWREGQNFVDKSGLRCHFDFTLGHGMHPDIVARHLDYQQNALAWYREAAQDLHATLTKLA